MGQIISSLNEAQDGRGVYIIYKKTAKVPKGVGTSRSVMVCQLPWGPDQEQTDFVDPATFMATFAPPGFPRTGAAFLMATKFPWLDLHIIRVVSSTASKASKVLLDSLSASAITLTAKYKGTAGNSISVVIAAATNAVANSFNMTLSRTDAASGYSTVEFYENVDSTNASAAYWTALTANSLLVGGITQNSAVRPVNGTFTLASATDGTVAASDYVGTQGSADKGVALLEKDPDVDFLFPDDPGSGLLAAVNAGFLAHENYMDDQRVSIIGGLAAETLATAKTNRASYQHDHVGYVWGHGTVRDDTLAGNLQTIPLTGPTACLLSTIPAHLSGAIKRRAFTKVLQNIVSIDVPYAPRANRIECEKNGIIVYERNADGVFSPYCAPSTASDLQPLYVTRMRDYIGFSLADAVEEFRNDPNDDETIADERVIILGFFDQHLQNKKIDHINRVCIADYQLLEVEETNTQNDLDNGDVTHGFKVQLVSEQKRIFLFGEIGTTVKIAVESEAV